MLVCVCPPSLHTSAKPSKWTCKSSDKEARYSLGRVRAGDAFSREVRPPVWKAQLMWGAGKPKRKRRKMSSKPSNTEENMPAAKTAGGLGAARLRGAEILFLPRQEGLLAVVTFEQRCEAHARFEHTEAESIRKRPTRRTRNRQCGWGGPAVRLAVDQGYRGRQRKKAGPRSTLHTHCKSRGLQAVGSNWTFLSQNKVRSDLSFSKPHLADTLGTAATHIRKKKKKWCGVHVSPPKT